MTNCEDILINKIGDFIYIVHIAVKYQIPNPLKLFK